MPSDIFKAYRAIVCSGDKPLENVFASVPDGPDLFALVASEQLHARQALVYEDRDRFPGRPDLRRWRPTLLLTGPPDVLGMAPGAGEAVVLADNTFPAGLRAVAADLVVVTGPAQALSECSAAVELIRAVVGFAAGYRQLEDLGAAYDQIRSHPEMRRRALMVHQAGVRFSAAYREGLLAGVAELPPPPGARQLDPAQWLTRTSGPGVDVPPFTMAPIKAPLRRGSGAALGD